MERLRSLNKVLANFIFGEKFFIAPNIIKGLVSSVIVCIALIPLAFFIFYLLPFLLHVLLPRAPKHEFHVGEVRPLAIVIWTLVFSLAIYIAWLYDISKRHFSKG